MKTDFRNDRDAEFAAGSANLFKALNATLQPNGTFVLNTQCGPLICQIYAENSPWIHARFTDMAKAKAHFGTSWPSGPGPNFNPYSGKWNFHPDNNAAVDDMLHQYLLHLASFVEAPEPGFKVDNPSAENTEVCYQYRDADNYKVGGSIILQGNLTPHEIKALAFSVKEGQYFIPGLVGMNDLQDSFGSASRWDDERDHPYHEITAIASVDAEPTDEQCRTASEWAAQMVAKSVLAGGWDDTYKPEFYEAMARRQSDCHFAGVDPARGRG